MENPNAFPLVRVGTNREGDVESYVEEGMTLRDYFAAEAMQSIITNGVSDLAHKTPEKAREELARVSYLVADAMLAERSK